MGYSVGTPFSEFGNGSLYANTGSYALARMFKSEFENIFTAIGPGWTDLTREAQAIPLFGQQGDPDRDTDGTLLFDAGTAEQVAIRYQMPHSAALVEARFHLHWSKTTEAAGEVLWQARHKVWSIGEVEPDWGDWVDATVRSHDNTGATKMTVVDAFPGIDLSGQRESCMVKVQARRNAAAAGDTYAADARLEDVDAHVLIDRFGSPLEYTPA
jgi:hypothetical protein